MDSRLCSFCGAYIDPGDEVCLRCGAVVKMQKPQGNNPAFNPQLSRKSRTRDDEIHKNFLSSLQENESIVKPEEKTGKRETEQEESILPEEQNELTVTKTEMTRQQEPFPGQNFVPGENAVESNGSLEGHFVDQDSWNQWMRKNIDWMQSMNSKQTGRRRRFFSK